MFGSLKKDAYQKAWDELCAECPNQKFCHDECIECDEFYDLLEEYERELKEDENITSETNNITINIKQ